MSEPYFEDIETLCSVRRGQVLVLLRTRWGVPVGNVISGVPVSCNFESGCCMGVLCLLRARQLTSGRKRR